VSKIQALVVREELEHVPGNEQLSPVVESLRALQADVCIPFINKNSLVGFCVLGPRTTDQMYSDQDLSLLMTLAQAAAIALDNAVLYEELKRSQTLVRRTDRLRSLETIAGGFAHEVRNPLTSIKTFIQLTPERKDDPEFIGHFSTVVAEDVARIERLIEEILDYARYMEPKFMEEDINDVVESCLYSVRIKADTKSVSLQKDLARNLPPVTLDRQQIKQVLLNLLLNAIEAMGPASGRLIVKTHRLTKSGGDSWVQVEVTDTGCGIAPGDLDHIFDPFYTTKHASDEREGTGIGLTIVHQIVQEHGGHITVDSKVGRGTTFLVNLPINPVPAHSTMGHARV
jgi:signal transduction histidine kinase